MRQFIFAVTLFATTSGYSQDFLPVDYPVKVKYTEAGHTYLTGQSVNGKIWIEKYINGQFQWDAEFVSPFPSPNDRGIDVAIDSDDNIYITGYVYDNSCDILRKVVLKYDVYGIHQWATIFEDNDEESSGISIFVDLNDNVYSCGFITDANSGVGRNFYVQKLAEWGDILWTYEYNDREFDGDDIATSLLVDNNFVYVMGYSYRGGFNLNDIVLICLDKDDGKQEPDYPEIYSRPYSNEIPTDFMFAESIHNDTRKTRSSVTVSSDNINLINPNHDYLTLFFDGGVNSNLVWASIFDGGNKDVPLALTLDDGGDIIVTGYSFQSSSGSYDFATIKYDRVSGIPVWQDEVFYFDEEKGIDQATSVLFSNNNIYVTGMSKKTQLGFYTVVYNNNSLLMHGEDKQIVWKDFHVPVFSNLFRGDKISYSKSTIDENGNVITTGVLADENGFRYCIYSYDSVGNKRFEYEDDGRNYKRPVERLNNNEVLDLFNFPNPFNPVTKITYTLPVEGLVTVRVYNVLGQMVKELVNAYKTNGTHFVEFDATNLPSGVYYCRIQVGGASNVKRMMLLK